MHRGFWLATLLLFNIHVSAKEYIVGVEDVNYYPLFDFDARGTVKPSFARDLLTRFFESENLKFKFLPLPIKRFDRWYIEHSIDFKYPDNFRWRADKENKMGITFSNPVIEVEAGTYVLKAHADITRDKVKKLATIRGFYPTLWIKEVHSKQLVLHEENLPVSIVKQVLYGYSDATNIDKNVIRESLKRLGREGEIVLAKNIMHQRFFYHFSSITHPEVIEKFNRFLENNQPFIQQLKAKYNIVE